MSGFYYLLAIIAVFVVFRWYIQNDGGDGTKGLLAVKPVDAAADAPKKKKVRKKWTREGAR